MGRKAFAVLRVKGRTVETIVDLTTRTRESWRVIEGAQPRILSSEWARGQALVKDDPRWRAAMRARGYTTFDEIFCDSLSAGYFGPTEDQGRRLLKMPCYDVAGATSNVYARPIEGVIATVDLDAGKVLGLADAGVVPIGKQRHDFTGAPAAARLPAPAEWRLKIDGHRLSWRDWSFHLGFDQRFGPVLSLIEHRLEGPARSVLYQAHVSEVFVPYMEPSANWLFRNYMDAGEYGLGTLSSRLVPGIDCPPNAVFRDAVLPTPSGGTQRRDGVICVFERNRAAPLWRHAEAFNGIHAGRPARELIVRSIPSIAHYGYVVDWVFQESGAIEVRIGATGIDAVKAVVRENMFDLRAAEETRHGALVASGLVAVNHDHYFSLRLDFDVDGPINRFVRERLAPVELAADNRRRSLWRLERSTMAAEGAVPARPGPAVWLIDNSTTTTLGYHPGFQIQGRGPTSLLHPDDWPAKRAAFAASNLWITAYRAGERHAAGRYPNQSRGGDGLPAYANGEAVDGRDLVAWYTMGFHHVPRPEDWPVLSTVWQVVKLRPYGFFTRNPSVMAPSRAAADPS